jgi:urease accessory protein
MLRLIREPVAAPDASLPEIAVRADRHDAARRRWRVVAEDGAEFGFELERPLRHGAVVAQTPAARYVLRQHAEPVLIVSLELPPSAAAGLGWAFGNMHLEASSEPGRLIVADCPAARQLLGRLGLPFACELLVFRPGHFARGLQSPHELGPSHRH